MVRVLHEFAAPVEQAEVHAPTVHGDPRDLLSALLHAERDAALDARQDFREVPPERLALLQRPVGETVRLGDLQPPAVERPAHHAAALGAQVNRQELLGIGHDRFSV